MSWFTDLASKAEELLNKVDKGAATALGAENGGGKTGLHAPFSTGRSGSTSSEPLRNQSPKISRKSSTPDLTSLAAKANQATKELGAETPRSRTSNHKKTLSNSAVDSEHNDEALLEFLNAPSIKAPPVSDAKAPNETEDPVADDIPDGENEEAESTSYENSMGVAESTPKAEVLDAQGENALLRNEIHTLNQEVSQLFGKMKNQEKELKKLRQDLEKEKDQSKRLNMRLREREDNLNDVSQLVEVKDAQVGVMKVRLNEIEEKLRVTEAQLQAASLENERILQASTESSSFQSHTMEALRKQVEDIEETLSRERETNRLRNQESQRKIVELEESQAALVASVAEAENRQEIQAQIAEKRRQDLLTAESRIEQAQRELSEYKQKAQRILQSKEKLIAALKEGRSSSEGGDRERSDDMEMEQLRQERDLLREETGKQQAALDALKVQLSDLDAGHQNALAGAQDQLRYQNELLEEERSRTRELQNQCSQINDELVFLREDLTQQKFNFAAKLQDRDVEIEKLRKQLMAKKMSSSSQVEVETRLQALTQNLIQKQTLIEQLTTEKSTLSHQLERTERQRDTVTYRANTGSQDTYLMINSTDDAKAHIPSFMVESPMDSRMARRMKRVYSTLDTFSIRLGVFLRRFPMARIMVLAYMGLLHFWVMVVLLTYQPEVHDMTHDGVGPKPKHS